MLDGEPGSQTGSQNFTSEMEVSEHLVWGTTVNVQQSTESFQKFFDTFEDPNNEGQALYPRILDEAITEEVLNLNLNCHNLHAHNPKLYNELVNYPQEIISFMDLVVNRIKEKAYPDSGPERVQVRPFNLIETKNMRELNPNDVDTLVAIKGMVIRCGSIIPEMKVAFFQCLVCDFQEQVLIDDGKVNEPTTCQNCKSKHTMQLVHNRCEYADKQLVRVQETPDSIPEGETPHTVNVFAWDNLVDVAKPGDRVEITGVYRAVGRRVNPRQRAMAAVYKTYIDAIHFKKWDNNRLTAEYADAEAGSENFTSFEEGDSTQSLQMERERELKELSMDPQIYERLVDSIAPSIWQMEDVKKGILCMLFGGANNEKGASQGRFRGEINVLMCGDPGSAKSQLLQYAHNIAPRGIYTSGKGSSAVGLTAYVSKDPETGEHVLESGALVLSDRGVCCIDEFDKMNDATRSILHEVMEQQTVSIAKAGIVCTLNARTSILASANPIESRYNPELSVVKNIDLTPTLLSRFDLIYLILDNPDENRDRKLAKHLVSLYYDPDIRMNDKEKKKKKNWVIPKDLLTRYISYARRNFVPQLCDEAVDKLVTSYMAMRQLGQMGQTKVVTATPRQLESMIRLAEALARMRFSDLVELEDVEEADRLMQVATQKAATDPKTGKIDMDSINTGVSTADRQKKEQLVPAVREHIAKRQSPTSRITKLFSEFQEATNDTSTSLSDFREALEQLSDDKFIKLTQDKKSTLIRRLS